jgi:hypothetical protein
LNKRPLVEQASAGRTTVDRSIDSLFVFVRLCSSSLFVVRRFLSVDGAFIGWPAA